MSASDDGDTVRKAPDGSRIIVVENALPDWVTQLKPLAGVASGLAGVAGALITFGQDPVGFIFRAINFYILGGILAVVDLAAGAVLYPFNRLVGGLGFIQAGLIGAFSSVGIDIQAALLSIQSSLAGLIATAGPAGPLLAVGAAAVGIFVLYRLTLAILVFVPGGDSLLTFFGGR